MGCDSCRKNEKVNVKHDKKDNHADKDKKKDKYDVGCAGKCCYGYRSSDPYPCNNCNNCCNTCKPWKSGFQTCCGGRFNCGPNCYLGYGYAANGTSGRGCCGGSPNCNYGNCITGCPGNCAGDGEFDDEFNEFGPVEYSNFRFCTGNCPIGYNTGNVYFTY